MNGVAKYPRGEIKDLVIFLKNEWFSVSKIKCSVCLSFDGRKITSE